ncbi:MAG: hypothetical protein LWW99_11375 [Deltaproteobacteria bacterium]|nr:hypothetical protein [Deltaproteobacteria bacterium]
MEKVKGKRIKICLGLGIVSLSFCIWFFPSNVVELIARHRHVLLGRYSVERFSLFFFLTPILWLAAYALWASIKLSGKQVAFRVIALVFSVVLATLAIHILGQLIRKPRYIEKEVKFRKDWPGGDQVHDVVRHRPPNSFYRVRYTDAPHAARSYPDAPAGYPAVNLTLTSDARGYRNLTSLEQYDIVTVGDSFTEGSRVSDDEPWPILLGKKLNRNVYNLGISGGRPDYYLNVFRVFGLDLRPKVAIFMIYEGNDFKGIRLEKGSTNPGQPLGKRIEKAIKYSPVVMGFKTAFIKYLGPINADGPVPGAEILSWMPVAVPPGPGAKYYAFRTKRLTRLYWTECEFRQSFGWTSTVKFFKMIKDICDREGIRLVFAYAPSKPHVVMPLAKENISPEHLHAFASLKKRGLPAPKEFKKKLYDRLGSQENVLREFCQNQGIEFVSATTALQKMAAGGHQVYYTYDQHWTRLGHVTVAEELFRYFTASETGETGL